MMKTLMPFLLSFAMAAPSMAAVPRKRTLESTGENARNAIVAAGSTRLPLNVFIACSDDMDCVQQNLAPNQKADAQVMRTLIAQHSPLLKAITAPEQLQALRRELDRLGTLTSHVDAIQIACASEQMCTITPYDGEFFD